MLKKFNSLGTAISRKEAKMVVGGDEGTEYLTLDPGEGGEVPNVCSNHSNACCTAADCGPAISGGGCKCGTANGASGQICIGI